MASLHYITLHIFVCAILYPFAVYGTFTSVAQLGSEWPQFTQMDLHL